MTVYVDDMRAKFRGMIMCHMISDDVAELHVMAGRIGILPRWFQGDHYDISLRKRALAVEVGAVEITWRQASCMAMCVRRGLPMPKPEIAVDIFKQIHWARRFLDVREASPFEGDL